MDKLHRKLTCCINGSYSDGFLVSIPSWFSLRLFCSVRETVGVLIGNWEYCFDILDSTTVRHTALEMWPDSQRSAQALLYPCTWHTGHTFCVTFWASSSSLSTLPEHPVNTVCLVLPLEWKFPWHCCYSTSLHLPYLQYCSWINVQQSFSTIIAIIPASPTLCKTNHIESYQISPRRHQYQTLSAQQVAYKEKLHTP